MACRVLHPVNHTVSIPHSIAASAARRPLGAFRLGLRQARSLNPTNLDIDVIETDFRKVSGLRRG